MRAHLPLRLTRAAAFSAVCVALAALGHLAAGGSGPRAWAVTAGGATITVVASALAGRERSAVTIGATLTAMQLFLHELFAFGDPSGISLTGHPHGGQGLGESLGMLVAHLTATLITGWWLARGEAALWSLLQAAGKRLSAGLRLFPPPAVPPVPRAAPPRAARPPVRRPLRHIVSRRGPPLPAA